MRRMCGSGFVIWGMSRSIDKKVASSKLQVTRKNIRWRECIPSMRRGGMGLGSLRLGLNNQQYRDLL